METKMRTEIRFAGQHKERVEHLDLASNFCLYGLINRLQSSVVNTISEESVQMPL